MILEKIILNPAMNLQGWLREKVHFRVKIITFQGPNVTNNFIMTL